MIPAALTLSDPSNDVATCRAEFVAVLGTPSCVVGTTAIKEANAKEYPCSVFRF